MTCPLLLTYAVIHNPDLQAVAEAVAARLLAHETAEIRDVPEGVLLELRQRLNVLSGVAAFKVPQKDVLRVVRYRE